MPRPIITLTTDFGQSDPFVGAMKGVLYSVNRDVEIVDISHAVNAFDTLDGALTVANAYAYFPNETIHVVVVDPGVGSARRPILVRADAHTFVAPDNGVLSLVYERSERISVRHIDAEHYFRQPVSQTFHGRDIFAPVAGWLSKGVEREKFGDEITDFVRFALPKPKPVDANTLKGVVMKVDRFGNLLTNVSPQDVPEGRPFTVACGKANITKVARSYAEGAPGEPFVIVGSSGWYEVSANKAAANRLVGAERGAEVVFRW
jgi:S-adenosyl-L-methionine hydrolase (adenosine-forming)